MFIKRIKRITVTDILHIFCFLVALPVSLVYKRSRRNLWLICEDANEARDNGYWLYKYIRENFPEKDVVYAIRKQASDFSKVDSLGEVIQFGSIKHWIYYLVADKNISTHKGGKPNAAICYLLEVYGILKNKRVLLQHGITINNPVYIHYNNARIRLFVCGALPEYKFVKQEFGYPEGYVQYLGFCRFDNLHNISMNKKQILVMPTWRDWLYSPSCGKQKNEKDFEQSEYYEQWNELLTNKTLQDILIKNDTQMIFCPHRNMQNLTSCFHSDCKNIIVAEWGKHDVQKLLKESALLITDYSSVSMDFAYMKKPVLYYQFDGEQFRNEHLAKGYFSYEDDGFGKVCYNTETVVATLIDAIHTEFAFDEQYEKHHRDFFELYDARNCERNYYAINQI